MSDPISYLTVYNAHSGESTKIPKPVRFSSLQKLKIHLLESFTDHIIVSTDNIFLLTPFGIRLDFAMVNEMSELFLYDRRLFQKQAENALILRYLKQADSVPISSLQPSSFALLERSSNNAQKLGIKEISMRLKDYEKWANSMSANLRQMNHHIDVQIRQINAIFKALNIIFSFASNFVGSTEKLFKSQLNCVKMLAMKSLNKSWKMHFAALQEFPTFKLRNGAEIHLDRFLDENSLDGAAHYVSEHLPNVISQFNELSSSLNQVNDDKLKVDKFIELHRKESMEKFENFEASRQTLAREIDSIMAIISSDMRTLDTAPSEELQQYYLKHADICVHVFEKISEMYAYLESFHDFKMKLAQECPEVYESIAVQQMKCVEAKTRCKDLLSEQESTDRNKENETKYGSFSKIKEYEDMLSGTVDIPLLFGFVLVEKRRQFEWHDFYSKGIVSNVSEQLTVIVERERVFQKLWIKKFGKLIKLITPETGLHVHVPSIDVTLVNAGPGSSTDSVLNWLGESAVERDDVLNYIALVRQHKFANSDRFGGLLERNFKDLVASTETLKVITRTVVSLGSHSLSASVLDSKEQIRRENGQNVDDDAELNLIKGLKSRIKKLEDLLHQQQFKNLTGWPVVKSIQNQHPDNRASLLLTTPKSDGAVSNPINFLPRATPVRRSSQDIDSESSRKVLDASTTIDKHLDNIRLRKENVGFRGSNSKLLSENEQLRSDLAACRRKWENEQHQTADLKVKLHEQVARTETMVSERDSHYESEISVLKQNHKKEIQELKNTQADLAKSLEERDSQNEALQSEISSLKGNLESKSSQVYKDTEQLRDELSTLTAKLSDLQIMNAELLSNMQAKESEFSTERSDTEKKIKDLEYKLEEKTEDFEDLMEMTQSKSRSTEELLNLVNRSLHGLLSGVGALLLSNVDYFHELCVILESMGLLLVRESNTETNVHEFRIRRVKGLRSKKDADDSRPQLERTKSTAVQELTKSFAWITTFAEDQKSAAPGKVFIEACPDETTTSNEEAIHDLEALETETRRLIQQCETYALSKGDQGSKIAEFLRTVAFEENVQLQAREDGGDTSKDRFFSNGIIKRFNDVEGFAKKLTKENKAKTSELAKLVKHSNTKISVKDFQPGDLVLFLPTRIERAGDDYEAKNTITPWTAFNIDAPHYFLDLSSSADSMSSEEWIVNRISKITEHVVTEENAQTDANPFSLSVGIIWYMITTE